MADNSAKKQNAKARPSVSASKPRPIFPFTAIVGQEELKLALLLNVVAPSIGGVLIMGHRGTGKSTAVRSLAELLPPFKTVRGCAFNCDSQDEENLCANCRALLEAKGRLPFESRSVPVVDLPLGATEDRVCGTIDFERALQEGVKTFEPGILARANRGFLYVDEVNLLEDHLVDLLLDVAATGRNVVEREGVSTEHAARFVLVGSGNPEEGELRPQLLDRFGLYTQVRTISEVESRMLIVERRETFEREPARLVEEFAAEQARLRRQLIRARKSFDKVEAPRTLLRLIAELCLRLKIDGHRGEITIARAARALAAFEGRKQASPEDVRRVAPLALGHRLRRDPLEQTSGGGRIDESVEEIFGGDNSANKDSVANETSDGRAQRSRANASAFESSEAGESDATSRSNSRGETDDVRGETKAGQNRGDSRRRAETRVVPPVDASLPDDSLASEAGRAKASESALSTAKGMRGERGNSTYAPRGRYVRATASKDGAGSVALDATLRAAAPSLWRRRNDSSGPSKIETNDLRYKRFRRKAGRLFILAVDTSGSMAVNRIGQAKGALAHLLRRSYVRRDRVALISFRERGAELLLAPCNSPARAKRMLDALPVGGATPLAAGLVRALDVARRAGTEDVPHVMLVLFTDGRANVALGDGDEADRAGLKQRVASELERLGSALQSAGVSSLVVDTQSRFTSGGEGQRLARALGGRYVNLPQTPRGRALPEIFDN
ncbi:MAG TPA: magnesium chelatase ATPase subunit I [Pyrinomonadaceae bacterium]|nr:magnesium chelatase ATPase subunit I [Pyrinomonadaceae bacterium]